MREFRKDYGGDEMKLFPLRFVRMMSSCMSHMSDTFAAYMERKNSRCMRMADYIYISICFQPNKASHGALNPELIASVRIRAQTDRFLCHF